jgi:hypothetical protein
MGTAILVAVAMACPAQTRENEPLKLTFVCREENDLYQVALAAGMPVVRCGESAEAVAQAEEGSGVLLLADGYPDAPTVIDQALLDTASAKHLRLYIEYPSWLPGVALGEPRGIEWERAVVSSDWFAPDLAKLRILAIHGCRFRPVEIDDAHIVLARVAGFDTAVYGLPEETHPILFELPKHGTLVATTKLSQFVTARYAPTDAWRAIWPAVLGWLGADGASLDWTPTVRPSFAANETLPDDVEEEALRRGTQWFYDARLLPSQDWQEDGDSYADADRVGTASGRDWPAGDGSQGLLEGFSSTIGHDGRQPLRWWLRDDCMGEGAMALAFDGVVKKKAHSLKVAGNLADFILFDSDATKGPRDDPDSPSFGLVSWDINKSLGVFYGDDNARSMLGVLACAALTKNDRWDEKILRCFLANLRTTGQLGFRGGRIDEGPLHENGWRHYFDASPTHYAPHYESYMWACYIWAHNQTGHALFLERAKNAIRMTMDAYPDDWRWTNGLQQERARMLLCLSWLVRVEDIPEHREWLRLVAEELLEHQAKCGAIREELGPEGKGAYGAPTSNEHYGTTEAPLIQKNGDPLCDLLYTTNFAFLGLHEAAAATGDPFYADAEDRLARFLCRIQIRSEQHPELDGGWFRAFDYARWEYWASNADLGWGAWSIESGWTCGWINAVLAMRQMETSLWDLTAASTIERHMDKLEPVMFPEAAAGE